uniref:hypothetical protein n=1 Tax=Bartonella bovis TaxID=155194 RepID=UPI0011AFD050
MTDVRITGTSGNGVGSKGVIMESSQTLNMTNVGISKVEKAVLMNGAGTLRMDNVQISDVAMGVEAMGGTLEIKGHSTIVFKNGSGNYGVRVGREVTSANLTNVKIAGGGSGTGVWMEGREMRMTGVNISEVDKGVWVSRGTVTMEEVRISDVAMGVEATAGRLEISGGSIEFKDGANNYGVKVGSEVTMASLKSVTITGTGSGTSGSGEG